MFKSIQEDVLDPDQRELYVNEVILERERERAREREHEETDTGTYLLSLFGWGGTAHIHVRNT